MLSVDCSYIYLAAQFGHTVELRSLKLACLKHHGSLELFPQSRQIPYIFNVKIHPRLEQRWLELKTRTAGQFLMYKPLAGSNQYLPSMNHSDAWYKSIIFHKRSLTMMILHLGKSKLTKSFIEQNVSIEQLAVIYYIKVLSCSVIKFLTCHSATNELFCYQQFAVRFRVQSGQSLVWAKILNSCLTSKSRPWLACQRNNIQMTFHWRAVSGLTPCADWIQTGIRLCGWTVWSVPLC